MEKFQNQGLTKYCDQDIKDFEKRNGNFHCSLCSKNIIDFRKKSKAEFERIMKDNPGACGIYHAYQIEPDVSNFSWSRLIASILVFTGITLSSKKMSAQSQDSTTTERHVQSDSTIEVDISINSTTTDDVVLPKKSKRKSSCKSFRKVNRRRFYVNRRFPFLHYGRRFTRTIGVPTEIWH